MFIDSIGSSLIHLIWSSSSLSTLSLLLLATVEGVLFFDVVPGVLLLLLCLLFGVPYERLVGDITLLAGVGAALVFAADVDDDDVVIANICSMEL